MFRLGNYWIDEICRAVLQNRSTDAIIGTLDELNNATVSITAESTDIVDHKGNLVKKVYQSKTGTFEAETAYLSIVAQNIGSGSDIEYASSSNKIEMPKMEIVVAGGSLKLTNPVDGTIHVQGLYKDGGNGDEYTLSTSASLEDKTFGYDSTTTTVTVPGTGTDAPIQYLVFYQREVESGIKLMNEGDSFPATIKMTLQCAYYTPCNDLASCYVYIPSFQPSPETEISLDSETQTMSFSGDIQLDACGTDKVLYIIYFPDESAVVTVTSSGDGE